MNKRVKLEERDFISRFKSNANPGLSLQLQSCPSKLKTTLRLVSVKLLQICTEVCHRKSLLICPRYQKAMSPAGSRKANAIRAREKAEMGIESPCPSSTIDGAGTGTLALYRLHQSEGKRNTSEGDYTALIDVPLLVTMQRSPCLRHSLHERINWR
jgi:hypothetical protein